MGKSVLTFFISSIGSFILMVAGVIIWTKTIPLERPSDADGLGFFILNGSIFAFFISIILGIIVAIISFAVKNKSYK